MTKKNRRMQYRQGDVLVMSALTADASGYEVVPPIDGGVVLAFGEVTGHKHQLRDPGVCLLAREGFSDRLLTIDMGARLVHEEHDTIDLAPGSYTVRVQREFSETESSRVVAD